MYYVSGSCAQTLPHHFFLSNTTIDNTTQPLLSPSRNDTRWCKAVKCCTHTALWQCIWMLCKEPKEPIKAKQGKGCYSAASVVLCLANSSSNQSTSSPLAFGSWFLLHNPATDHNQKEWVPTTQLWCQIYDKLKKVEGSQSGQMTYQAFWGNGE